MSLDIYLTTPRSEKSRAEQAIELLRANGFDDFADELHGRHYDECGPIRVFDTNITHNLGRMAEAGGFYREVWCPDELGITKASQMIHPLRRAIQWMQANRREAEKHNAKNGWGMYEHFLPWLSGYLAACEKHPDADIQASR